MITDVRSRNTLLFVVSFVFYTTCLFWPRHAAHAASGVTGKYVSGSGASIVLSLSILNPSPTNLIVEQYLAAGNQIVSTSPRAKKIDNAQGQVKWLFRNIKNGTMTLTIQLSAPLKGQPRAMIRYRDPNGGRFTELRIAP